MCLSWMETWKNGRTKSDKMGEIIEKDVDQLLDLLTTLKDEIVTTLN